MKAGAYISGAGHLILILWVILGGVIFNSAELDELEATDVRLLSEEEFLELAAVDPEPETAQDVTTPVAPLTEDQPVETSPGDEQPELAPRPEISDPTEPDAAPEPPDLSIPQANVETATPDAPLAPVSDEIQMILPTVQTPGRPRDAPRVAALPTPEAPPTAESAPEFVPPQAPSEDATIEEAPVEEEPPAAPEVATTEIVTEATAQEPEGTPITGMPPRLRPPDREIVAETPNVQAEPDTGGAPDEPAIVEPVTEPPVGPPLTFGEVDQLVAALQNCWSIGTLSTAAASSTVVVGVTMDPNGTPVGTSIRMLDGRGPDDRSIKTAFEYAKRAVLRCGRRGFPLPKDKFAHWAEIEITFSPEEGLLFE